MAKPICLIKIAHEGLWNELGEIRNALSKKMEDYHVFVIPDSNDVEPISVQVFYEKDFTEIQYQELKEIIENSINNIKNHGKEQATNPA